MDKAKRPLKLKCFKNTFAEEISLQVSSWIKGKNSRIDIVDTQATANHSCIIITIWYYEK